MPGGCTARSPLATTVSAASSRRSTASPRSSRRRSGTSSSPITARSSPSALSFRVTALEIRRDVEGYSGMNEDAFARRFYADRSELESLRIQLTVERPADGAAEQENYSLRPENFHLPPIEFTDKELAALQTALSLLDGEFAYAEPLRLALQQITWGRPSPLKAPEQCSVALGITASAGGHG